MDEDQRDQLLIETHGLVAGMSAKLAAVEQRMEDHTGRITVVEAEMKSHTGWRSRMTGAWVAITIIAGIVGAVAALALSLYKK